MNPGPGAWSRGLGPGAWAWGLGPGPASGNLERVHVLQPSSIKNDLDQYSIKKTCKTCTRSRLPLAARGRGPRPSRGASPLGYAARAMLPGLWRTGCIIRMCHSARSRGEVSQMLQRRQKGSSWLAQGSCRALLKLRILILPARRIHSTYFVTASCAPGPCLAFCRALR